MVGGIETQITSRLGFEDKGRLYRDQLYSQRGSFSQNTRQRRENDSNPERPNAGETGELNEHAVPITKHVPIFGCLLVSVRIMKLSS